MLFILWLNCVCLSAAQFEWQVKDTFDEIEMKMDLINAENCETKQISELTLPKDSVPQIPSLQKIDPIYENRTMLRLIHDSALNRAFFYSFLFAKVNDSEQPGLMYYYASQIADVSANYYLNGSGIIFSPNTSYPNFYRDYFNKTLNYFGPYAFRTDDYLDLYNPNKLATLKTVKAIDMGADIDGSSYLKYDRDEYWKVNEWYRMWLPDDSRDLSKTQYHIILKYITQGYSSSKLKQLLPKILIEEQNFAFFGPPDPAEAPGPVKWTLPYFDCRRSNKWIITAVSPVIDYFPRHTPWKHLRKHKYVAVSSAAIDFNRIDINPCPKMRGNEEPNLFAGIARCKNTTVCEPLHGYGFRRGGYQCVCRPGYRYPPWQSGPFLGEYIEKSTKFEYEHGFDCWRNQRIEYYPNPPNDGFVDNQYTDTNSYAKRDATYLNLSSFQDSMPYGQQYSHSRERRSSYEVKAHVRLQKFLDLIRYVNPSNCHKTKSSMLGGSNPSDPAISDNKILSESLNYQAQYTFESQIRIARRTAHFLSYYLQRVNPHEILTDRITDQYLTVDQIYGEVLANVMSGYKIIGSGIFFDLNAFQSRDGQIRPYFAPYAYKTAEDLNFVVVDRAANVFNEGNGENDDKTTSNTRNSGKYGNFELKNDFFNSFGPRGPNNFENSIPVDKNFDQKGERSVFYYDYVHNLPYFRRAKEAYGTLRGTDRLTRFNNYINIRADKSGSNLVKYETYPDPYYASEEGAWHGPYFNCEGPGPKTWLLTYATPFFGNGEIAGSLAFKGVVTIDVELNQMDINQCPDYYSVSNPFKGSDTCHYESQYCVFLPGKGFKPGGYKCECKQGYEYPFNIPKTYFEGDEMESEYQKMLQNKSHRYNLFKCRIAGAATMFRTKNYIYLFIFPILLHCAFNFV